MVKLQNRVVLLLAVFSFTAMASTVLLKTSNDFIKTFGNLEKLNRRSYLEFRVFQRDLIKQHASRT